MQQPETLSVKRIISWFQLHRKQSSALFKQHSGKAWRALHLKSTAWNIAIGIDRWLGAMLSLSWSWRHAGYLRSHHVRMTLEFIGSLQRYVAHASPYQVKLAHQNVSVVCNISWRLQIIRAVQSGWLLWLFIRVALLFDVLSGSLPHRDRNDKPCWVMLEDSRHLF